MIYLVKNETFKSNSYVISDNIDRYCLIIDPGLDSHLIDQKINEHRLTPIGIIATHGHFDHIGSASYFQSRYSIPFYLHEEDFKLSQSANFYIKITGLGQKIITPRPDYLIKGKFELISLGEFKLGVYNFSGHTKGSSIIEYESNLFTGDIIYKKGLGFNSFPGEDRKKLRQSLTELFNLFDDEVIIYPGHGKSASLGNIKNTNTELLEFIQKEDNYD